MADRKPIGKKLRFEIFKRDDFTCQYCGKQPPACVLEVDHINPVAEGGSNDEMNLATSCDACNRGKGKRKLGNVIPRPDADLKYLKTMQEVAELKRFEKAKLQLTQARKSVCQMLQDHWCDCSGLSWHPSDSTITMLLSRYEHEIVFNAIESVSLKVSAGRVRKNEYVPYLVAVCRNISQEVASA
jgi:hypothetical protein